MNKAKLNITFFSRMIYTNPNRVAFISTINDIEIHNIP